MDTSLPARGRLQAQLPFESLSGKHWYQSILSTIRVGVPHPHPLGIFSYIVINMLKHAHAQASGAIKVVGKLMVGKISLSPCVTSQGNVPETCKKGSLGKAEKTS